MTSWKPKSGAVYRYQFLTFVLTLLLAFCGGPLFVAQLLEPSLGRPGLLAAVTPLIIALPGAFELIPPPKGWAEPNPSDWSRRAVLAGVSGLMLVALMNAFTIWQLAVGPDHPDRSLIIFGIIMGTVSSAVYVHLARRHLRLPRASTQAHKRSGSARLSEPRLTAQLVLSATEAYLAYSGKRNPGGPHGEIDIATILHTRDGGATWAQLSWHRSLWSRVRYPAFPTWPPEAVMSMEHTLQGLQITHRDEFVPFEPGGEALWQTTFADGSWFPRWLRYMDYERQDSAAQVTEIALELPSAMGPPQFTNIAIIVQSW